MTKQKNCLHILGLSLFNIFLKVSKKSLGLTHIAQKSNF